MKRGNLNNNIHLSTDELHDEIRKQIIKKLGRDSSAFFIQIGSNDGVTGDPIHHLIATNETWRGIFVEPLRHIYKRLVDNYGKSKRYVFENVAIDIKNGVRQFYYVSSEAEQEIGDELPYWYDQLGSFNRNHISKFLNGRLQQYILSEEVDCITLNELVDKYNVTKIDLLHIDAEGFDYLVLSQLDLNLYKPSIVLYEHEHLSSDEKLRAISFLNAAGYTSVEYGENTLAMNEL